MTNGQNMGKFVASGLKKQNEEEIKITYFNSSILHLLANLITELSRLRSIFASEIRMMSSITLNTDSPTLLCHSENKSPSFLWVKVGVCQN